MPDAQGNLTKDERTTPVGLYHYAVSYEEAGRILQRALNRDVATHPSAPINHVLIHAIELYLKSFLRLKGASLDDLKFKFGHNMPKLATAFAEAGGKIAENDVTVCSWLTPENIFAERYIIVGAYADVGTHNLAKTAANLRAVAREAIRGSGEYCCD